MTSVEIRNDRTAMSAPFSQETFTIGRSPRCDICLPDPKISRIHITLRKKNNAFSVVDKSVNGTLVNGVKIAKIDVGFNDEISIGEWKIKIKNNAFENETTHVNIRKDPTCLLSYHEKNKELVKTESVLVQTSPIQRNFRIKKQLLTIGKSPLNDIVVEDSYVSGFHCRIELREDEFFLKDLQSTNGTFLNGHKIIEAILNEQSTIEIGKVRFTFHSQREKKKITQSNHNHFHGMVSTDPRMKELFSLIESLKSATCPILIQGETGTGKELVARAIHENSSRQNQRFVTVNCGAIPKELIESELFGHEKGSFTGATVQREGLFEQAHNGTLFLDEIGELPLELQPKLLRVLETGEVRRVGSSKNIHVDVRIVTATHRHLQNEVQQGRFREDLFYRIFVLPICLPPLRDRKKDIPPLVEHFLHSEKRFFAQKIEKRLLPLALEKLMNHSWPGNIRELKNVMERAIHGNPLSNDIGPHDILFAAQSNSPSISPPIQQTLQEFEKEMIYKTLEKSRWNKKITAEQLGIAKSTLHEKVKKYGIQNGLDEG